MRSSVRPVWPTSFAISDSGMTPIARPPRAKHRVSEDAHQADVAAAVDEFNSALDEEHAELLGGSAIGWTIPGA